MKPIPGGLITDFGLPPEVSAYRLGLTPTSARPRSYGSMPPEPASNVYSLACILFACLTGEPPFVRESPQIVFYAHCTDRPPASASAARAYPRRWTRCSPRRSQRNPRIDSSRRGRS